jgi:hypothetical protein
MHQQQGENQPRQPAQTPSARDAASQARQAASAAMEDFGTPSPAAEADLAHSFVLGYN